MRLLPSIFLVALLGGATGCSLFFGSDENQACSTDLDCGNAGLECNDAGLCVPVGTASSECGNSILEVGELCDGDCPVECSSSACGPMELVGSAETCDARCEPVGTGEPVCGIADECCPSACDAMRDVDCIAECGNGVLEPGEICDGIDCPTSCDQVGTTCSPYVLQGSVNTCDATCVQVTITDCINNDGCCGGGCNANNDSDCAPVCGNDMIEEGELCDGASCGSCDDGQACTLDAVASGSAETCDIVCTQVDVLACTPGDGCCPSGCDATQDSDCSATCGNDIVESPELCDGADCPTSCESVNACLVGSLVGSALSCSASCSYQEVNNCESDDGCCPTGCDASSDNDCPANCGNGVLEPGEFCELGDCPESCSDGNACTVDTLTGNPLLCTSSCSFANEISDCVDGDGCCPGNCDHISDSDCSDTCLNGELDDGETCDGDCPESCDDANACTVDVETGSADTCSFACSRTEIVVCNSGDGCCALGCDSNDDSDCSAECGDGVVDIATETCDGDCPSACDDFTACTVDLLTGSAEQCNVQCSHTPQSSCVSDDGCCPNGCNANNDTDCSPVCGNGVVESEESCDGNCPGTCNDDVACTVDSVSGSADECSLECLHVEQTFCIPTADGCCPASCNANNDADCEVFCGNDVVEGDEACDGNCPVTCDDENACTIDSSTGIAEDCSLTCLYNTITECTNGDGCCADACSANTDSDCEPTCGNGAVELGEICDGDCPEDCSDGNVCTTDSLAGAIETCDAVCISTDITTCIPGDGCCADGCNANTDTDCTAECGNGVLEGAEVCDDGGESATCDVDCTAVICGDGVLNATVGEACDTAGDSETCNANCTAAVCGDGYTNIVAEESCDDAGESTTCNGDCTIAGCGDGLINAAAGEVCDDGPDNSDTAVNACRTSCQPAHCGDGIKDIGEICDDGGDSDNCTAECTVSVCGDGYTNTVTEQCDDGNAITEDCEHGPSACVVCDDSCQTGPGIAHFCGDASHDILAGEECDRGEENSLSCNYGDLECTVCTPSCVLAEGLVQFCGDGNVDSPDEGCDEGEGVNGLVGCGYGFMSCEVCDAGCELIAGTPAYCGDGILHLAFGEGCDDGNNEACEVEGGCAPDCERPDNVCGDGFLECEEECDLGADNGEECVYGEIECIVCDYECKSVNGHAEWCGDGEIQGDQDEQCDDGEQSTECNSDCSFSVCGDGVVNSADDEQCDDGDNELGSCVYGVTVCVLCNETCESINGARYCGDTVTNAEDGEQCDDGLNFACDAGGCAADCSRPDGVCGDGHQECGELCDLGGLNTDYPAFGGCTSDCLSGLGGHCGPGAIAFDTAVENYIVAEQGLGSSGNVLYTDVASVAFLSMDDRGVTDLVGLDCMPELQLLQLSENANLGTMGTSLTPLQAMVGLRTLELNNAGISTVADMGNLTQLNKLELDRNVALGEANEDFAEIGALANLSILSINESALTTISGLSGLANIAHLYLDNNRLTDESLSAIADMSTLSTLSLNNNELTVVNASIADISSLNNVSLRDNSIADFSPLLDNPSFAPAQLVIYGNLDNAFGGSATAEEKLTWCAAQQPVFEALELRGTLVVDDCD